MAGLIQATDGNFYGTTPYGPLDYADGTVFRITPDGTFTTLLTFDFTDGAGPLGGVIQATDGNLYGAAWLSDTIYQITLSGTLTTLYKFCTLSGCADGQFPESGLVQGTDGNLYGAAWLSDTIYQITLSGTLTTLYKFCTLSGCADGQFPESGLVQGTDGNLYGTTTFGGAHGSGTVFKISLSGTLTTLDSFCARSACADGADPFTGLIQATDGNLYGVTASGGAASTCEPFGRCATAFRITPTGTLTTLQRFCPQGSCADGEYPFGGLAQATNGAIYGTAQGNQPRLRLRLRDPLRLVRRPGPVCGNPAGFRRSGDAGQHPG